MFDVVEESAVEMSQRSLEMSRKVAKASVTRKINEIMSLMCTVKNVNVVIAIESSESVKLAAEKAAMIAEVSLLHECGSLTQERLCFGTSR